MSISILIAYIEDCRTNKCEATWEGLKKFKNMKRRI